MTLILLAFFLDIVPCGFFHGTNSLSHQYDYELWKEKLLNLRWSNSSWLGKFTSWQTLSYITHEKNVDYRTQNAILHLDVGKSTQAKTLTDAHEHTTSYYPLNFVQTRYTLWIVTSHPLLLPAPPTNHTGTLLSVHTNKQNCILICWVWTQMKLRSANLRPDILYLKEQI